MVQLVDYREIALADQGGDHTQVHLVAGGVDKGGFPALESGKFPLQLHVQYRVAVEEARPGHAGTVFLYRVYGGLFHPVVVGQPQVIIGAEHYEFFTLYCYFRCLFGFKLFKIRVDA